MSFIWVNVLWALLIIPLIVLFYLLVQRRRHKFALRYASLSLVKEALGKGPGMRRHIPAIIFLVGLAVMIVGIARPAATVMLPSQQGTVILTIDVSGSMRADDLKPNRLEAAKVAARTFVEKQPRNVRIGVVSFSDNPAVVQAPTNDRETVLAAIDRLTTQRGTGIGRGILASIDTIFEEPGKQVTPTPTPNSREPFGNPQSPPKRTYTPVPPGTHSPAVIVLLSDGENNIAPSPLDVIQEVAERGVRVYTVGVGSVAGSVLQFEGFSIRVRLDEATLKRIADRTDGSYFKADNETDLQQIYENLATRVVFKSEQTELTAYVTAGAAAILLLAGALSLFWFNRLP